MGLRTSKYSEQGILAAFHDERLHGMRSFWSRQPLLGNGTFTDGTVDRGTAGTVNLVVPAGEVWFLKKINIGTQSTEDGTSYPTRIEVDGVAAGTRASMVCDTVFGDLLTAVGSVTLYGTMDAGTFSRIMTLSVEGYKTSRVGFSSDT